MNLLRRNSSNQKEVPASVPLDRHNEVEAQLRAANDDNRALRERNTTLKQEVDRLGGNIEELEQEIVQLKQKIAELEDRPGGLYIGL